MKNSFILILAKGHLDLIVQKELKIINDALDQIRNNIKYVRGLDSIMETLINKMDCVLMSLQYETQLTIYLKVFLNINMFFWKFLHHMKNFLGGHIGLCQKKL